MRLLLSSSYLLFNICAYHFLQVLRAFKALHRTRMSVFKDDVQALTGTLNIHSKWVFNAFVLSPWILLNA